MTWLSRIFFLIFPILGLLSCSHIENINTVEGKVLYEEHYATFNNINYESGEIETFGASLTSKKKYGKDFGWDYSFYPDVTFESSKLRAANQPQIKIRRISAFLGARGTFYSIFGIFDLNVALGPSYIEAYNEVFDTSKVEPTFRYEGVYTLFFYEGLFGAVSFTFQESPSSTYSEYYSLMYKVGYRW